MEKINYLVVFKESFTLVILVFCSVLSVTFAIERWLFFRKAAPGNIERLIWKIRKLLDGGKTDEALELVTRMTSPAGRICRYAMMHCDMEKTDLENLLATKCQEEKIILEKYLGVLGTMGNIAPFIGLFGTVVGIIKAFRDLAVSSTGGPTVVAKGIAEALVATAGGLAVAIPAVILYNYFMRKLKVRMSELEIISTRMIILLNSYRNAGGLHFHSPPPQPGGKHTAVRL